MATLYGHDAYRELTSNLNSLELAENESVKVNHVTCEAGEDTRKRFGVKYVDGAYLFHCFNCGDSGYYRNKETLARITPTTEIHYHDNFTDFNKEYYLYAEQDANTFDIRGQLWLGGYGFNDAVCRRFGIRETPHGIILPILFKGETVGYQLRRYDGKPKYSTYKKTGALQFIRSSPDKPIVIVEDLLSSYKLNMAGYSTVCLLGTKLDLDKIVSIGIDRQDRCVIWLDDDEAGHMGAVTLFKELSPVVKHVTSINLEQPKEFDVDTLKEMDL